MLEYTVLKEKGGNQYYVCRVGEEKTLLSKRYTEKKKALKAAAGFEGMDYKEYMKVYRKEKQSDD